MQGMQRSLPKMNERADIFRSKIENEFVDGGGPPKLLKKKSATSSRVTCQSNKQSSPSTHPRSLSQLPPTSQAQSPAGNPPPPIHPSESSLSRKDRTGLARLRSGYSRMLKFYLNIVDETVADSCPDCNSANHTVHHLFKCPVRPTTLTTLDLWHNPAKVASFLDLEGKEEM